MGEVRLLPPPSRGQWARSRTTWGRTIRRSSVEAACCCRPPSTESSGWARRWPGWRWTQGPRASFGLCRGGAGTWPWRR